MSVLPKETYETIATNITTARDNLINSVSVFYDNVEAIVLLDDVQQTLDLLEPMYSAYTVSDTSLRSIYLYQTAISALNNHVITRGGYADINAYFLAESVQVSSTFAELSGMAGFDIDVAYII